MVCLLLLFKTLLFPPLSTISIVQQMSSPFHSNSIQCRVPRDGLPTEIIQENTWNTHKKVTKGETFDKWNIEVREGKIKSDMYSRKGIKESYSWSIN